MVSSKTFLRATVSRLKVRCEKIIVSSISEASVLFKNAPDRIEQEWDALKEEIVNEAFRLDAINNPETVSQDSPLQNQEPESSQNQIDRIREKISIITKSIEG
ncbi:hypothetical protein [Prochlorococcus marinus]|uniref:hypothetical protein n=1 Tax=Prochlorococcus marinus TaxID=1219 RepID=UPI0022B59F5E|nr:hypothetical protein [Prochlorococcus marinus]